MARRSRAARRPTEWFWYEWSDTVTADETSTAVVISATDFDENTDGVPTVIKIVGEHWLAIDTATQSQSTPAYDVYGAFGLRCVHEDATALSPTGTGMGEADWMVLYRMYAALGTIRQYGIGDPTNTTPINMATVSIPSGRAIDTRRIDVSTMRRVAEGCQLRHEWHFDLGFRFDAPAQIRHWGWMRVLVKGN